MGQGSHLTNRLVLLGHLSSSEVPPILPVFAVDPIPSVLKLGASVFVFSLPLLPGGFHGGPGCHGEVERSVKSCLL